MTDPTLRTPRVSVVRSGEHGVTLRAVRPAIFLDRDGTLIKDVGYLRRPEEVELLPGAAMALRAAHNVQRSTIVVTNQSGIARGLLTVDDYLAVRKRVGEMLAEFGAYIDDEYHCPHHPDFTGPCDCRKPGIALFEKAILDHGVDAAASTFIGDRWRDIEPALHYGGRGVLVPSPITPPDEIARAQALAFVATSLLAAVESALASS